MEIDDSIILKTEGEGLPLQSVLHHLHEGQAIAESASESALDEVVVEDDFEQPRVASRVVVPPRSEQPKCVVTASNAVPIRERLGESSSTHKRGHQGGAHSSREDGAKRVKLIELEAELTSAECEQVSVAKQFCHDWCGRNEQGYVLVTPRVALKKVSDLSDSSGRVFLCPFCGEGGKHSKDVKRHVAEKHIKLVEYESRQLRSALGLAIPPSSREEWLDIAETTRPKLANALRR